MTGEIGGGHRPQNVPFPYTFHSFSTQLLVKMSKKVSWTRSVTVLGCGGVSQCALPLFLDLIDCDPKNVTVIDMVDNRHRQSVKNVLDRGVKYVIHKLTEANMSQTLSQYVPANSLLIDLAYSIDTAALLEYCHENNVLFVNTSVEEGEDV